GGLPGGPGVAHGAPPRRGNGSPPRAGARRRHRGAPDPPPGGVRLARPLRWRAAGDAGRLLRGRRGARERRPRPLHPSEHGALPAPPGRRDHRSLTPPPPGCVRAPDRAHHRPAGSVRAPATGAPHLTDAAWSARCPRLRGDPSRQPKIAVIMSGKRFPTADHDPRFMIAEIDCRDPTSFLRGFRRSERRNRTATSGTVEDVLAVLAPGQGSQKPGFLADWLTLPGVEARLRWWSVAAGVDLIRLGTEADADEIRDTAKTQPLLVAAALARSEEHTSELQSRENLVCRLLLEKKNKIATSGHT